MVWAIRYLAKITLLGLAYAVGCFIGQNVALTFGIGRP
jgi:hypothetical protein